jgi:hypothetical protein
VPSDFGLIALYLTTFGGSGSGISSLVSSSLSGLPSCKGLSFSYPSISKGDFSVLISHPGTYLENKSLKKVGASFKEI